MMSRMSARGTVASQSLLSNMPENSGAQHWAFTAGDITDGRKRCEDEVQVFVDRVWLGAKGPSGWEFSTQT